MVGDCSGLAANGIAIIVIVTVRLGLSLSMRRRQRHATPLELYVVGARAPSPRHLPSPPLLIITFSCFPMVAARLPF